MLAFAEGSNAAGAVSSVTIIHDEHKDPNVSRRDLLPGEEDPGPNFVNIGRLEICQKFYTTGFLCQKFYTLKIHKLGLILPTIRQR